MRRLLGIGAALLLVLAVFAPTALAANPTLPHTGRVLVSTGGDLSVPAGDQADAVVIVNGTATIAGQVNAVVAVDATVILNGATVEIDRRGSQPRPARPEHGRAERRGHVRLDGHEDRQCRHPG